MCAQFDEAILTHMAHQLQSSTAESAVDRVSRYTRQPELVVRINKDAFKSLLPLPQSESINLIFKRLWLESTKLFPEVDYIYYGDKFGAFVGYERLPQKFVEEFDFSKSTGVFCAEFRAPDGAGAVQLCEMCPPAFALRPGAKTYYFVNDEGVYLQSYREHAYDPRERPWYQAAAAGKGELVWLELYKSQQWSHLRHDCCNGNHGRLRGCRSGGGGFHGVVLQRLLTVCHGRHCKRSRFHCELGDWADGCKLFGHQPCGQDHRF